jgi:hypothetical protein
MDVFAQSARSRRLRKCYKCPAINHLRGKTDKAREGLRGAGASLLKSDLALADMQNALGVTRRQCKVQAFTRRLSAIIRQIGE